VACAGLAAIGAIGSTPLGTATVAFSIAGVAAIGFWDDIRGVRPSARLAVHITCSAVAMQVCAEAFALLASLDTFAHALLWAAMAVAGAWFVNMFNFMDGIDGLAAMEGTFVLVAAGAISLACSEGASSEGILPWAVISGGAAVAGFLVVNVSPWRIFMGDAGSGALGLLVAWALAACAADGFLEPWAAMALPAAFTADACSTLSVRVLRSQSPAQAHRTHAYQRLVRRGTSHVRTTTAYTAVNLIVVLPVAVAIQRGSVSGPYANIVLHGLLAAIALAIGAGREPAPKVRCDTRA
jgi:Fuc2NAc and GlcNAc transferase